MPETTADERDPAASAGDASESLRDAPESIRRPDSRDEWLLSEIPPHHR